MLLHQTFNASNSRFTQTLLIQTYKREILSFMQKTLLIQYVLVHLKINFQNNLKIKIINQLFGIITVLVSK